MPTSDWSLTARWVFPVDAPPLERGVVTIAGDRILAVEPHGTRTADQDLGNAAILPGLVNVHTHLDLSGTQGKCAYKVEFTEWLREVIAYRQATRPEQTQTAIHAGLAELLRFGTTLIGDIASDGASWNILQVAPLRAVVFYEVLGLTETRAKLTEDAARAWLMAHPASPTCRPGISPHAPYSVRESLIVAAARLAQERHIALAIHLAESLAEVELLHHHRGPFVPFLKELGVWDRDGLVGSHKRVMKAIYIRAKPRLFIHCNHLAPSARIPPGSVVVYCPRTHAAFGHPPHPFREFLARGVRVALGTDSLASNPDLNVLAEVRFVHGRHPDVPGDVLLRMVTLSGAEALGWADETGSLMPGKSADLVVLPLPNEEVRDPHELVLQSAQSVRGVLFRGQWTLEIPSRNS
jgi:cytosine/adenosine deaminase-related metal-dependent hydrolase